MACLSCGPGGILKLAHLPDLDLEQEQQEW
jgi:hypothetical protein